MTSAYENKRIKGLLKTSVITFSDQGTKTVYRPLSAPHLMTGSEKVLASDRTFFITMWAYGSQSVMYRVFDSSAGFAKPLCEIISFSDLSENRVEENILEIRSLMTPRDPASWKWVKCRAKVETVE